MFNQNEIIAGLVVLLLVIIYFFIRKTKSVEKVIDLEPTQEQENEKLSHKNVNIQKEVAAQDPCEVDLGGSEEGDFGENCEAPIHTESDIPTEKRVIQKRTVPAHGKITKQNFSEFDGERILIAEDNLINQTVITGLLAGSGIDITIANDGQEALDILEKDNDFLMILMDAHMPNVDGFEATRTIRKNPNYDHILVVALSGDTAADDVQKMREAGMSEQLEKPLRMESLYDVFYAYTGTDTERNSSDFVEVVMTKELDGEKGLDICGGDENFYKEILNEFTTGYKTSAENLKDLIQTNKIQDADKLLLDIIGITANIGADSLNTIAIEIKASLQKEQNQNSLTLINKYSDHLNALMKDIQNYG